MTDPDVADSGLPREAPGYNPPSDCGKTTDLGPILWTEARIAPDHHSHGYAILGGDLLGLKGEFNKLLVPKVRITGIECAKILDPSSPNYWAYAWDEAKEIFAKKSPDILLGVNSYDGRTQDQLHIHLTAFKRDLRTQLDKLNHQVPRDLSKWNDSIFELGPSLNGATYVYRIAHVASLDKTNPFTLLNHFVVGNYNDIFAQSLAIVAGTNGDGYFLIATQGKKTQTGQPDHPRILNIGKDWGTSTSEGLMDRNWR